MLSYAPPFTVDDTNLTSNVPAEEYPAWDADAAYAKGSRVQVEIDNVQWVREAARGALAESAVTVSIASPGVVTWPAHGLPAGTRIMLQTTGALPTGLTAGTIYYLVSPATDSFGLAATAGGAAINTSGSQSGVHTAVADPNKNQDPVADEAETWWLKVSAANIHRMFDAEHSSQTTNPDSIVVGIQGAEILDTAAIVNTDAVTWRLRQTDPVEGVVLDITYDLLDESAIIDEWTYCFGPFVRIRDKAVDLYPYADSFIESWLEAEGDTVACGGLILGQRVEMGGVPWGSQFSLVDTSVKTRDAFGGYRFTERPFYKTVDTSVWLVSSTLSYHQNQLAPYRARPILWIVDKNVGAGIGLAIYEDLTLVLTEGVKSLSTLRLGMLI